MSGLQYGGVSYVVNWICFCSLLLITASNKNDYQKNKEDIADEVDDDDDVDSDNHYNGGNVYDIAIAAASSDVGVVGIVGVVFSSFLFD